MRYLWMAVAACGLIVGAGCATTPAREQGTAPAVLEEEDAGAYWKARYQDEVARGDAIALRLATLESRLEWLAQERADAALYVSWLQEDLGRVGAEQRALEEHNAQLSARQRELTALHDELSDLWYSSALSRARRRGTPGAPAIPLEPDLKGAP